MGGIAGESLEDFGWLEAFYTHNPELASSYTQDKPSVLGLRVGLRPSQGMCFSATCVEAPED